LEDEEQRMRPELPVTKEVMKEYRQKLAELSKRPIRKVLDAQGRKKQKMRKRIQSAKNKAEVYVTNHFLFFV
jgi:AdoMet-dependent rRNA methyltransferase SPB1